MNQSFLKINEATAVEPITPQCSGLKQEPCIISRFLWIRNPGVAHSGPLAAHLGPYQVCSQGVT